MTAQGSVCKCNPCQHAFASRYVVRAVSKKKLVPAKDLFCVDCGTRARDYDHYVDYRPENVLAVQPVCRPCHQKRTLSRRASVCRLGHPYTMSPKGTRFCRECRNRVEAGVQERKRLLPRRPRQPKSRVVTIEAGLARLHRRADVIAERAFASSQAAS